MENGRIQDIPSMQKALSDLRGFKSVKAVFPFFKPVLKVFGVNVKQIDEALAQLPDLEKMAARLVTLPDRFNDQFGARGWIIYDLMNVETAISAVERAESGDVDGAEEQLVEHYSAETVGWLLMMMNPVQAFRPRMPLARKALEDYGEGRYHACVPVVLALLDGMVNDIVIGGKRQGFFAEDVDLTAWDSIAAHEQGLGQLVKLLQATRMKTTTEPISIPYRHGILHGMDLGYDNKMVAAKTWAALFAARDWALKAEQGMLVKPADEPKKTFKQLAKQLLENEEDRKLLEAWQPRHLQLGEDVPTVGNPEQYDLGSPERALVEFLEYWKARNYGRMSGFIWRIEASSKNAAAGEMRSYYGDQLLEHFQLLDL